MPATHWGSWPSPAPEESDDDYEDNPAMEVHDQMVTLPHDAEAADLRLVNKKTILGYLVGASSA